ncbi:hypothetical protein KP509_03G073700 [Ceratopteris richardii]|uniref:Uncharacterized protein n=1 Tax=Ceratopteris richardii TaxID=49495 RepID=A0A8T2V142_CERRI|nr:hypothetical protein KP509_03G073700 [Ceratopteris richardii]
MINPLLPAMGNGIRESACHSHRERQRWFQGMSSKAGVGTRSHACSASNVREDDDVDSVCMGEGGFRVAPATTCMLPIGGRYIGTIRDMKHGRSSSEALRTRASFADNRGFQHLSLLNRSWERRSRSTVSLPSSIACAIVGQMAQIQRPIISAYVDDALTGGFEHMEFIRTHGIHSCSCTSIMCLR